jgi:regulator of protease activity HflC (stomatin/prohibitin superfamily)
MSLDKLIAAATDYFTTGAELNRLTIQNAKPRPVSEVEQPVTAVPKKPKAKAETVTDTAEKLSAKDQAALDAYEADAAAARERDRVAAEAAKQAEGTAVDEQDDLAGEAPVNYEEEIRPLIRTKSLGNRDGLVALLASFGAKSGAELTADQHAPFFAKLKAL